MHVSKRIDQFFNTREKYQLMQISIGLIYCWFGGLKFFAKLSPAEALAAETIQRLTFQLIAADTGLLLLATGETLIGVLLIANLISRITISLALVHMICTFSPLVLMPEVSFHETPFSVTLVGQYIIKNLVIISALLVLYPEKKPSLAVTINSFPGDDAESPASRRFAANPMRQSEINRKLV